MSSEVFLTTNGPSCAEAMEGRHEFTRINPERYVLECMGMDLCLTVLICG
jgi:hypothetical protein